MSHSTRHSQDAMLPASETSATASTAGSSTGSSAVLAATSVSPSLVQQLVEAAKASPGAKKAAAQPPALSSLANLPAIAASSVPAVGGVPEDLSSLLDHSPHLCTCS